MRLDVAPTTRRTDGFVTVSADRQGEFMAYSVLFIETKATVYGGQKALLARCAELDRRRMRYAIVHPFVDSAFLQQARETAIEGDIIRPSTPLVSKTMAGRASYILAQVLYLAYRGRCPVIHADAFDSAYLIAGLRRIGLLRASQLVFTIRSERYRRFNRLDRALLRGLDDLCTNSDFSRQGIATGAGRSLSDIAVTYTPIDFGQWATAPGPAHTGFHRAPVRLVIGYMGSLEPRKRLDRFLDFGHRYARSRPDLDVVLRVYGTAKKAAGTATTAHSAEVASDAEVIFAGYATPAEAAEHVDLLFCPFDDEPLGRVVAEFLYLGVPVIAMNTGGLPEAGCGHARLVTGDNETERYDRFESYVNDWLSHSEERPDIATVRQALEDRFAASNVVDRELAVHGRGPRHSR